MENPPRYLFVLPDITFAQGGLNLILEVTTYLDSAGYDVAPLYPRMIQSGRQENSKVVPFYDDRLSGVPSLNTQKKGSLSRFTKLGRVSDQEHSVQALSPRESDVFVVPEFCYPEAVACLPIDRCILFAQDVYGLVRAQKRDKNAVLAKIPTAVTTSDVSEQAYAFLTKKQSHRITVNACRDGLRADLPKKRQIAYFRRKREGEIDFLVNVLKSDPLFSDWTFLCLSGLSNEEVSQSLSESLIFLSFSVKEGFGLPPAEAKVAGCIVVGYTGVGGREFFSDDIGFPIPDDDVIAFAETVQRVVEEYSLDPRRLDDMRQRASVRISEKYSSAVLDQLVCEAWDKIHAERTTRV